MRKVLRSGATEFTSRAVRSPARLGRARSRRGPLLCTTGTTSLGSELDADLEWAPRAGQRSGGWFDRGPGVLLLKGHGAQVSEGRVQPPAIVDVVDEAGQVEGDVLEGLVGHRIDRLDL